MVTELCIRLERLSNDRLSLADLLVGTLMRKQFKRVVPRVFSSLAQS